MILNSQSVAIAEIRYVSCFSKGKRTMVDQTLDAEILEKVTALAEEQRWGSPGTATKSLDNLLEELRTGDSKLLLEEGELVRTVTVMNVVVTCGNEILVEDRQVFLNGDVRRRGLKHLAEKFDPDAESADQAIKKALKEEVQYTGDYNILGALDLGSKDETSKSYPGLNCRYVIYTARVFLPEDQKQNVSLTEVQPGKKTTYFAWEPAE